MILISFIQLAIGAVIPLLVGVITKQSSSSGVKAICNAVLSAAAAVGTTLPAMDGDLNWNVLATSFFVTFVTSITAYYGVLKPTGVSEKVQETTADFGV